MTTIRPATLEHVPALGYVHVNTSHVFEGSLV